MPRPEDTSSEKENSWMGTDGFDEAKYYQDETFGIGLGQSDLRIKGKIEEAYSRHYSLAMAEIELYGELVIAASSSDSRLPQEQIDAILGVTNASAHQD